MNMNNKRFKFRSWNIESHEMLPHLDYCDQIYALHALNHPDKYHVMQWSGLKDDNGDDIYEGDILKEQGHYEGKIWKKERLVEVVFTSGSFLGKIINKNEYTDIDSSGFEIVSNIYQKE